MVIEKRDYHHEIARFISAHVDSLKELVKPPIEAVREIPTMALDFLSLDSLPYNATETMALVGEYSLLIRLHQIFQLSRFRLERFHLEAGWDNHESSLMPQCLFCLPVKWIRVSGSLHELDIG